MPKNNPKHHTIRTHTVLSLCIAILALGEIGCLNQNTASVNTENISVSTASVNDAPKKRGAEINLRTPPQHTRQFNDEEVAYWQAMYKKNRTVPPHEFNLPPTQPRNNNYGEFDDRQFAGLDTQPQLPGMPGHDLMAMTGPSSPNPIGPAEFQRRKQNGDFHSFPAQPTRQNGGNTNNNRREEYPNQPPRTTRPSLAAATAQNLGATESGLMTETRFYPIEQLVFGGEFPDLDKPENYRLMPRDVISITVRDHPEFSGKLEIQPDGTIRIPNLSDLIRLRGMSVDEASEELRLSLQPYIRGECIVQIQANRARGGYYFVFGDVLQPGRFPMGLEPIKLSDAVLAANWETNRSRPEFDDEELGPAFPTATPRGKFTAPRTADMANVMLVTPHRSQPVRTTHDVRQAMLGMMREDPIVKPGQIIVVPSLDPRKNAEFGLSSPAMESEQSLSFGSGTGGFSNASSSARLPQIGADSDNYGYGDTAGYAAAPGGGLTQEAGRGHIPGNSRALRSELDPDMMSCLSPVQRHMSKAFEIQQNTEVAGPRRETFDGYYGGAEYPVEDCYPAANDTTSQITGYGIPVPDGYAVPQMNADGFPVATPEEIEWLKQQGMYPGASRQETATEERLPRRVAQAMPREQNAQAGNFERPQDIEDDVFMIPDMGGVEYSAMTGPEGQTQSRPRTEVSGLEREESISTREATPLRGRRLASPQKQAKRAEKRAKQAQNMKNWNLGF